MNSGAYHTKFDSWLTGKSSNELLEQLLEFMNLPTLVQKAMHNNEGRIIGFELDTWNKSAVAYLSHDIHGHKYCKLFHGTNASEIRDRMIIAVNTGQTQDFNIEEDADGEERLFHLRCNKMGDGVVCTMEELPTINLLDGAAPHSDGAQQFYIRQEMQEGTDELQQNRNLLNSIMQVIPDMVCVHKYPSRKMLYFNLQPYSLLGYDMGALAELSVYERNEMIHPNSKEALAAYWQSFALLADKEITTIEYQAKHKSGEWLWLRARGMVFRRSRSGEVIQVMNIIQNITPQKRYELLLQESKDELQKEHYFLEQVTDKTPNLIYVFDLDEQRFTYINKKVNEYIGRDPDYVIAMGPRLFQAILHPDDLAKREDYVYKLSTLQEQEVRENEFRIWVGHEFRWFRSKDSIFLSDNGKVLQVIGLAEDITHEKQVEAKARKGKVGLN